MLNVKMQEAIQEFLKGLSKIGKILAYKNLLKLILATFW